MGVYNDITDLRQQIDNITKENVKLREITWLSSHEVRRQLVNIIGLANLIHETPLANDKLGILENIDQSARELDKMIHVLNQNLGPELELAVQPDKII